MLRSPAARFATQLDKIIQPSCLSLNFSQELRSQLVVLPTENMKNLVQNFAEMENIFAKRQLLLNVMVAQESPER